VVRTTQVNPDLDRLLEAARVAATTEAVTRPVGELRVGVDLGTAFTVLFVVDGRGLPIAGAYRYAQVVRDGVVVDFAGAVALVRELKAGIEARIGQELTTAATTYPPGVPLSEVRATRYVLEGAGLECTALVDEPTAANAILQVRDGAVVDVGGGTTGIAVLRDGRVVDTADEPTGGTHLSLVIAGGRRIPFEEAELLKRDPANHARLFPVIRPVLEKIATIVARHLAGREVETIYLVGGTSAFAGIAEVVTEVTGIRAVVPGDPLFVTPLGVAMHDGSPVVASGLREGVHHG
jgi:ethanolamine utilization protein EutJ